MLEPKSSRPHWPDAVQDPSKDLSGLKPWPWALERLEKSHNYWISTTRPDGRPHLMIVWGIWWQDAFWFSTGPRTRKAKNIAADPHVVIGTEKADEAVILEGTAEEIRSESGGRTPSGSAPVRAPAKQRTSLRTLTLSSAQKKPTKP